MITLFEHEIITPLLSVVKEEGLVIMHYFVMTQLESLGTFLVLNVVDFESGLSSSTEIIC